MKACFHKKSIYLLMKNTKSCPVCDQPLLSDVTVKEYCALCGMIIGKENMMVKKFGQISKYFCCKSCYDKYKKFHANE